MKLTRNQKIIEVFKALTNINLFDTETTGLNNDIIYVNGKPFNIGEADNPEIIEIAFIHLNKKGKFAFYEDTCKPEKTIVGVMPAATHGYTNKMLENSPKFNNTKTVKEFKKSVKAGDFIVAHNMNFDEQMLALHDIYLSRDKTIDTLRVAMHCYKDGLKNLDGTYYSHLEGTTPENHQLQYFRYLFEMDDQDYFKEAMKMCGLTEIKPHTALSDVFVMYIFVAMLMVDFDLTLEDMVELTQKPILQERFTATFKDKLLNKTYDEIIYNDVVNPWGKKEPGYSNKMWAFENQGMSVDTEYSFIYHMSKAILRGRVPFIKDKKYDYKQFLYLGIKYCFSKEEIEQALEIINQPKSFVPFMLKNMEKKVEESSLETLPDDIEITEVGKWLSKRDNRFFLHRYTELYRKDIFKYFKED